MNKRFLCTIIIALFSMFSLCACNEEADDEIVLRISNWEEYIDLGEWDEEEVIDLDEETNILGVNEMTADFVDWYYETYGKKVRVEYSTFGTNEELYNQITIGDVYDLVCPSEYMIMKMMRENMLVPFSKSFYDDSIENNYYAKGVSPYIKGVYDELSIEGEPISKYAAGYMWGTLGLVYNPEEVSEEEASHWNLLANKDYYKRVTVKDSVRDAYFAAIALDYFDEITSEDFITSPDYHKKLDEILNRTDVETVDSVEKILTDFKENAYAFETDSGKADLVTGKVVANEQWSGDAVYTMDQADEDDVTLYYSAPLEGTNLWFDGWVMLDNGIGNDPEKQMAAEAFVNFVSKPENAIRNMYYIGYTSVISGGDSDMVYDYLLWNYEAEDDEEDVIDYDVSYFFTDDEEEAEDYIVTAAYEQTKRQLYAQYPTKDVVDRSVVMQCFPEEGNIRINRMWTNVRCFDLSSLFK